VRQGFRSRRAFDGLKRDLPHLLLGLIELLL
jgi:hypothetical protein